jgi:hypothetical protein
MSTVLSTKPHGGTSSAVLALVWGTTIGLILAHWVAFQLTARLFAGSRLPSHDRLTMVGQAVAALGVACLATVPLLLHANAGPALARGVLAGPIGLFAFGAARYHGGSHSWAGQVRGVAGAAPGDFEAVAYVSALANAAAVSRTGEVVGAPTEAALVVLAEKLGVSVGETRREYPRLATVPFDSTCKFMATAHRVHGEAPRSCRWLVSDPRRNAW